MRKSDIQLGSPAIGYIGLKADIEALTNLVEGMEAIATDTEERGAYIGGVWIWSALVGGGGGTNSLQIDCSGGTSDTYGVLSGAINGSNKVFTVSLGSYVSGGLQLYLNGQLLTQGTGEDWTETTPSSGTVTLTNAPVSGDVLIAIYKYTATTSGNADTLDGYEAITLMQNPLIGRGTVDVDFGVGDLQKSVTVSNALATANSYIAATILCKATTSNLADEIMAQPFNVKIKNQTIGAFDIVVTSLTGKAMQEIPVSYILMN